MIIGFYILVAFVLFAFVTFILRGLGGLKEKSDFDGHMEREAMAREPRLDRQFFIQMPEADVERYYGKDVIKEFFGTFSSRYLHIVVVDFDATVWVGVWREEVARTLANGRFEQGTYFVPLCGPGEGYRNNGTFTELDGKTCEIYPFWFRGKSQEDPSVQKYLQLLAERQSTSASYGLYKLMKEKGVTKGVS